jgi:hypothetical protein
MNTDDFGCRKRKENANKFECKICNFTCSKESEWKRHNVTSKHVNRITGIYKTPITHICKCGKQYKYSRGLWEHKQKCNGLMRTQSTEQPPEISNPVDSSLILELLNQNKELHQMVIELAKKAGNTTNNTNNTINNKFNLNVFLNETCKNAMTLTEFVKSMNLSVEDFVNTGELGYVNGISQIMVDRINNMELCDRPLHCTDLKRETVYVKDAEKWEKDEDNDKMRDAVKKVASKNERMRSVWYNETPNIDVLGSDNCEKFFKYSKSALGGVNPDQTRTFQDKIIRNVLKEVIVDKQSIE